MKIEIQSLRVINCGPLRDVCIDFCGSSGKPEPIIVLAGANGSGKTTLLELIVALSKLVHPDLEHRPKILDRTEYAQMNLLVGDKPFSVVSGILPSDAELPNDYLKSETLPLHPLIEYIPNDSRMRLGPYIHLQEQESIGALVETQEYLLKHPLMPSIIYFPYAVRHIPSFFGSRIHREETKYQWVYRYEVAESFAGSLDSYLIWLEYAEPENFAGMIDFLNQLGFGGKKISVQRNELKALVTTPDGQTHDLHHLSSGEQNILIMLLELRRRLIPGSLVLIDEIEFSLHPAFQYQLANALKKMQESIPFQLIVTTHAPAFLDIFGEASVRILTEF